jgi:hypothetical protein
MYDDKYRVDLGYHTWEKPWPDYFHNFWKDCNEYARGGQGTNWSSAIVVANHRLRKVGGKLIQTNTQGWYLRWDDEKQHTMFVLKWS